MSKLLVFATVSVSVFAFVVLSLSSRTFAVTGNSSVPNNGNAIVQELKENRCQRITNYIDQRIQRYDENKTRHIENHQIIVSKLTTLLNSLNEKGYDTTQLTLDLKSLNQMTKDFAIGYNQFINRLRETKTLGCGESEGQFKNQLELARTELKNVREKAQEIWRFIDLNIRKDLQDLRMEKIEVSVSPVI